MFLHVHVTVYFFDYYFYRSIVRRTVTCLSTISQSSWLILQYLIRYTCMEDVALCKGKHTLHDQPVGFFLLARPYII